MIQTVAVLAAIALTACNRAPTPAQAPANATTAAPSTVAAPVAAAAGPAIWFEPASVDTCDGKAVAVTVHWNARSVPGVRQVEVRPLGPGGKESLFMLGGAFGSRETGKWMTAGRTILLRDHANGKEIGRARLAGTACPK
ncbi:hypothetical protein AB4059_10290 [Lysobacter sp. 2RAF19]